MKWWLVAALVGLCATGTNCYRFRERGLGSPNYEETNGPLPPDEWFTQKLDHFNPTDTRTWKQRYFTNDSFFGVSRNGPVFLQIGGEGEASPKWMVTGAWLDYAAKYGALCFQLEHRFYGKSRPLPDTSVESLAYLSSEQALADLAYFIEGMNEKYGLDASNKWIVFGGSYPGSLAAWGRFKYPHLIHGAMSASGPLLAKADFKEYFEVVRDSLSTYSKECPMFVQEAIKSVNEMLRQPDKVKEISEKLKLCDTPDPTNQKDMATLMESLSNLFADIVQYNKDNRITSSSTSNLTIDDICKIMVDASIGEPLDRLAALNSEILQLTNQICLDFKYETMINSLKNTSWAAEASEGGRQWTYQTCTEFGFYQTSSTPQELFGPSFNLKYYTDQCVDIFGERFNEQLLNEAIKRSNIIYGELKLIVSRVVFVHGSIDPWHALGITETRYKNAPAIYIEGTAHCANMYPSCDKDLPQLVEARHKISEHIGEWLMEG